MKIFLLIGVLMSAFAASASAQIKSVYTSTDVKDCKTIEQSDEGAGSYVGECKGVGGYKLELIEGDIRQSVNIITPAGKKQELNFWSVSSAFSSVGAKVEWRVKKNAPIALIARFTASDVDSGDSSKTTSYLVVSKISKTESCITDVVKPGKTQNADARKLADAASGKPCKTFE